MMPDGKRIVELTNQGRYKEALGFSRDENPNQIEINKAHTRLSFEFKELEVIEALNIAKANIHEDSGSPTSGSPDSDSPTRPEPHLVPHPTPMARICFSSPVQILAVLGTISILWQTQNLFIIFIVTIVGFFFVKSICDNDEKTHVIPLTVLFWGGFSTSVYIILGTFIPTWYITRIILGIIIGFGIMVCIGVSISREAAKFYRPKVWRCTGIFCIIFMITIGTTMYLFPKEASGQTHTPSEIPDANIPTPTITAVPTVTISPIITTVPITTTPIMTTPTYIPVGIFSDDFSGLALNPKWIIINKNSDSRISLTGTGNLRITASPMNGGSEYQSNYSYNAPRILLRVSGEYMVGETKMTFSPTTDYQGAGVMVCYDDNPDSDNCDRAAEVAFHAGGLFVRSGDQNYTSYTNDITYFRLMKKGMQYAGWYSSDGVNWILDTEGTLKGPIKYVGLFAVRNPLDEDMSVYSTVDFDYIKIWSGESLPDSAPTPAGTTTVTITTPITTISSNHNPSQLSIRVGESWYIYGSEYMLTVYSVDTKTVPRQVWFSLSKSGQELDNKVMNEGDLYTFTTKNGDIIFKAKIDNIHTGSVSDAVTFTDISFK